MEKIAEKEVDLQKVSGLMEPRLTPVSKMARFLGLSRPTVYNRLDKLVELGVLEKDYREQRKENKINSDESEKGIG